MSRWLSSLLLVSLVANAALLSLRPREPKTSVTTHAGEAQSLLLAAAQQRLAECEVVATPRAGSPALRLPGVSLSRVRARTQGVLPGAARRGLITRMLRQEFGDDTYDALRYTTNQINRAEILEVVAGSPAASAGFEPGDAVLRYDGERIFGSQALRSAVKTERGPNTITVEIERAGRPSLHTRESLLATDSWTLCSGDRPRRSARGRPRTA
jgi:membrane-associated protease RseP (regulator of RpoE activity)